MWPIAHIAQRKNEKKRIFGKCTGIYRGFLPLFSIFKSKNNSNKMTCDYARAIFIL